MICKECERLNVENKFLHATLDSPQPGKEQNLYFQLQSTKLLLKAATDRMIELQEELTNLKEAFIQLRKDRDRLAVRGNDDKNNQM